MKKFTDWVYRLTASTKFFAATVVLLVIQSLWLALTAIFPLPFDEYLHLGTIQIYAKQWMPFITHQSPDTAILGELTRTGSYLFHYIMSFPYRVLDIFIDSQTTMIISLRLINIALVVGAMILFRQLFIMWKVPRRVMNVIFLIFVCIPIVPFVAAHINYDNLVILILPVVLIFGTRLIVDKGDIVWNGTWYLIFGMAGMVVKESFPPLFIFISLYVVWRLWREHGKKFWKDIWKSLKKNILSPTFIVALFLLVIFSGLFVERYGGNLIKYHTVNTSCDEIQSESFCENFGPWYRNREDLRHKTDDSRFGNPISFSQHWVSKTYRGFFVPFSHTPTMVIWDHEPFGPIVVKAILPVGFLFGILAVLFGLVAMAAKERDLLKDKSLRFALVVCIGYLFILWVFNYRTYLRLGEPEAIQARYWYPILPLLLLLMVKSANDLIRNRKIKAGILATTFVFFIWGGGVVPWLVRSDDTWYWQNNMVKTFNTNAQKVLRYMVIY